MGLSRKDEPDSAGPSKLSDAIPGVALASIIALVSILAPTGVFSSLFVAFALGIMINALWGVRPFLKPGIRFSSKVLLRIGIVLLGFQASMADVYLVGWRGL